MLSLDGLAFVFGTRYLLMEVESPQELHGLEIVRAK